MKRICVFCGASSGKRPVYAEAARALGAALVAQDLELVYGGGRVGLMGALADAVIAAGGNAIGVIPEALERKEVAHEDLTELYVVGSMHERKSAMARLADAFVALPGGFGTLEEFCEVLTWSQLGLHAKPCGLLDVGGYWKPLLELFDGAVREGFVEPDHRGLVVVKDEPTRLLEALSEYRPVSTRRWIRPEQA